MKKLTKLFAVMLAMLMVFALAIPALAATITIDNPVEGQTYTAYRIFMVNYSSESNSYAYTMRANNPWRADVEQYISENTSEDGTNNSGLSLTQQVVNNQVYNVTMNTAADGTPVLDAAKFAEYLNTKVEGKKDGVQATRNESTGNVIIDVQEPGYYFVTSSLGSFCVLRTVSSVATIREKNEKPDITKQIKTGENTYGEETTATVGKKVEFKLEMTVGKGNNQYVVHDKMSSGLTLDADSFKLTNGGVALESGYTIDTETSFEDGCTFEIRFDDAYVESLTAGSTITITYEATLNENAVVTGEENNKVQLKYNTGSSTEKEVKVKTYGFSLVKTDSANKVITGAKFKLLNSEDQDLNDIIPLVYVEATETEEAYYRPAVEGDDLGADGKGADISAGNVRIKGLANGTYYLKETSAPSGYNILTSFQKIKISDQDNFANVNDGIYSNGGVQVINYSGQEMPDTGGMGRIIFYVLGSAMVLGAGIVLVTRKRMNNAK